MARPACTNLGTKQDREDASDSRGQGSPGGMEKARRREGGGMKDETWGQAKEGQIQGNYVYVPVLS